MHYSRNDQDKNDAALLERRLLGRKRYAFIVFVIAATICVGGAILMISSGAATLT